ncbi:MAG: DUF6553 family protein [Lachnospiraceae bacterium]|jgi:hypothetical protein
MDASFLFEEKKEEVKKASWPEMFYAESEPEKRFQMLDTVLASEFATEDDKIRKKILEIRYKPAGKGMKIQYADMFLRVFLDCVYFGSKKSGFTSEKLVKKTIDSDFKLIEYDNALEADENYQKLYRRELEATGSFYIELCQQDKQYNSFLLGFGKISPDRQKVKIAKDFYSAIYSLSKKNGMFDRLVMWNKSLLLAFRKHFADWEQLMTAIEAANEKK